MSKICKNCGERIILVNGQTLRPYWTHQKAGASFMDGTYEYCRVKSATPLEE